MAMMTAAPGSRRPRQRGWYIPWLFVGFFAVVVAVNGVMLHFALSSWTGLETEDHFIKGIRYNRDLAGARAQAERGWRVETSFAGTGPRQGIVALTLHDRQGGLLEGATVTVSLIRPTTQGHDVTLALPYLGAGRYGAPVALALEGQWDLRVAVRHATGDYQDQTRIRVE